jgi:hypothetical protein
MQQSTQVNPSPVATAACNVRACIDNYSDMPGQVKMHSPLRIDEDYIEGRAELIREGIAPLCLDKAKKFISLQHQYFTKAKTDMRMEQDEKYVPISARVDFIEDHGSTTLHHISLEPSAFAESYRITLQVNPALK